MGIHDCTTKRLDPRLNGDDDSLFLLYSEQNLFNFGGVPEETLAVRNLLYGKVFR